MTASDPSCAPRRSIPFPSLLAGLLLLLAALLQALPSWNLAWLQVLNQGAGGSASRWAALWAAFSTLGLGLSMALLLLQQVRQPGRALRAAGWCIALALAASHLTKWILQVARPLQALGPQSGLLLIGEPMVDAGSMPSGHALAAFAVASLLASMRGPRGSSASWTARLDAGAWWALALAVAGSRVVVGAHWPADLLAGAGLGLWCGQLAWRLAGPDLPPNGPPGEPVSDRKRLLIRGLALVEAGLALALWVTAEDQPLARPMVWTLSLMAAYSALSRWRHADLPAGADAGVARMLWPGLLAGLTLTLLLREVRWQPLWLALQHTPAWIWGVVVLGLWGSYALRAERLRREWSAWGRAQTPPAAPLSLGVSLDIFLAHNAALVLLPMRAGEAGYPWLLNRRFGIPVAESVRSLVWLRLQDASVLGGLGLISLAPGGWTSRLALGAAALLVLWGVVPWLSRQIGQRWPRWQGIQAALLAHRGDRLGWGLCLANWCLKLGVLGLALSQLTGASSSAEALTLWQGWSAAVAGDLAVALPLQAPAGLGSYEAAIWAAGQWQGSHVPLAQLTGAALAVHLLSLASALFSFALYRALCGVRQWLLPRAPAQPLV